MLLQCSARTLQKDASDRRKEGYLFMYVHVQLKSDV